MHAELLIPFPTFLGDARVRARRCTHKMGVSIHPKGPVAHGDPRFHLGGSCSHGDELEMLVYISAHSCLCAYRSRVWMLWALRYTALVPQVSLQVPWSLRTSGTLSIWTTMSILLLQVINVRIYRLRNVTWLNTGPVCKRRRLQCLFWVVVALWWHLFHGTESCIAIPLCVPAPLPQLSVTSM